MDCKHQQATDTDIDCPDCGEPICRCDRCGKTIAVWEASDGTASGLPLLCPTCDTERN